MNVIFFGTPDFAARHLEALSKVAGITIAAVVTNPDRPAGRGAKITASPVKALAEKLGIPVVQPPSVKKALPAFLASVNPYGPFDIGVVVAFGQILPQEVLDLPKAGCVNVHASILPRWRGAAPIHRAIIAGDAVTGTCLMKMDAGLDTGPVYFKETIPITDSDTTGSIHDALAAVGSSLIVKHISEIASGAAIASPQATEGVTYAHKITNEEACIDWLSPAHKVHNLIRGLSPFPGAFTYLGNQRLKLFLSKTIQDSPLQPPGTVTHASGHDLRVACGSGSIAILELQLEGKKKLSAEEFLKAGLLSPGTRLGA